jgi:hypothetical protein
VGEPAPGEKIYTVVRLGPRPTELKEGHVTRPIADAHGGKAYVLVLPGKIPNGSPVLDVRGNLIGIVTSPHAYGEGLTVALAASRISQTVGTEHAAAASAEAAVAAQPRTSNGSVDDDTPAAASAPSNDPRPRNAGETTYRKLDEQRARTLEDEVARQVNGKPPKR